MCARPTYALLPPQSAADTRSYLHPKTAPKSSAGCGIKASLCLDIAACGGMPAMSNPPILPALPRKRAGLTFQLPPVPQFYRTGNAQASHPACAPMPLMKHAAVIGLADVGGVCSIASSPHALLLGKKDAKEENKPSFASLQRKEPLRLYRHSGSLRHYCEC